VVVSVTGSGCHVQPGQVNHVEEPACIATHGRAGPPAA
jgi:hypothetical protein